MTKRGRTKVSVGRTVELRHGVDLSDRWVPCTEQRKQEFVPAGIRGKVLAIDEDRTEAPVRIHFPVVGVTDWFPKGVVRVLKTPGED